MEKEYKLKPSERRVTFPRMGTENSETIKEFLESLELEVIMPKTTDETIKKGSRYCANMACFPLKITLGNYIESLDLGANTLLSYDTLGQCRFRQYNLLHKFILTSIGYDFEMFVLNPKNIVSTLSKVSGKSRFNVMKRMFRYYKQLEQNDISCQEWSDDKPNIGIIGEIFCSVDEKANFGTERKIRKYGGNPFNTATTTDFIREKIPIFGLWGLTTLFKNDPLKDYKAKAEEYMQKWRAGHAFQNLYNLLYLVDRGVDGIVHIAPLSCMPESTIEPYVDDICRKNRIPILRVPIDENSADANLEMRIETFVELIKIRKKRVKNG